MTLDLATHLGAMTREVKNLERDGKPAKAVVAARLYDTDPADLWDALTNQERLPRWFAVVNGDLVLGGRFQVVGNASGTITECVPHEKIAATWEFGSGISWIIITLEPKGAGTELTLEHIAHTDPHWDMFGPGAVGVGWELSFLGLGLHLANPPFVKPESEDAWLAEPEAKDFVRSSSDGWGQAAIHAGEDRDKALEAAENTRKFYTGEAPPPEM